MLSAIFSLELSEMVLPEQRKPKDTEDANVLCLSNDTSHSVVSMEKYDNTIQTMIKPSTAWSRRV